ncbi:hypothetical protein BGY98DRAFT_1065583 [Russula aff. rugulosa BPL654]|nr:hypothetical protein BGY98DRAFT_1065583 [Russula aff. rugulosa BPL654]
MASLFEKGTRAQASLHRAQHHHRKRMANPSPITALPSTISSSALRNTMMMEGSENEIWNLYLSLSE